MINSSLTSKLAEYLPGETERVGYVLDDGQIVECQNICDDPENGFDVSDADMRAYCDRAIATWHTHPGATRSLSVGDYETYLVNDELIHFIIAPDGVAAYRVEAGVVLNHQVPE